MTVSGVFDRQLLLEYPDGSSERYLPNPDGELGWLVVEHHDGVGNLSRYSYIAKQLAEISTSQGYRMNLAYSSVDLLERVVLRDRNEEPVCSVSYSYNVGQKSSGGIRFRRPHRAVCLRRPFAGSTIRRRQVRQELSL